MSYFLYFRALLGSAETLVRCGGKSKHASAYLISWHCFCQTLLKSDNACSSYTLSGYFLEIAYYVKIVCQQISDSLHLIHTCMYTNIKKYLIIRQLQNKNVQQRRKIVQLGIS